MSYKLFTSVVEKFNENMMWYICLYISYPMDYKYSDCMFTNYQSYLLLNLILCFVNSILSHLKN